MEIKLPELGEGIYEGELVKWLVQPGDAVAVGQSLAEVMTDKAVVELPSAFAGTVSKLHANEGDIVKVGAVLISYESDGAAATAKTETTEAKQPRKKAAVTNGSAKATPADRVAAAPSVRRKAKELGVDLADVQASGPAGRVLAADLDAFVGGGGKPAAPRVVPAAGGGERIPLRGLRRAIAQRMAESKHQIPHYSYIDECDATELVRLRTSLQPVLAKQGVKLTYLAFIIKAVAQALREVPMVNSSLDDEAGEIVLHDRCDVGFAVATEDGLLVPVIRNADRLSVPEIAAEIERLSGQARSGKAKRDDLTGGTFTVSSIGGIGGLVSTPIINTPEAGIMAVGKVIRRPVYDEHGQLRPADLVYLSFSFDHRVLDGAVGATFANAIIERLENPAQLLID